MVGAWRSWLSAIAGAWLAVGGFVFGTTGSALAAYVILGGLILVLSVWTALDRPHAEVWRSWLVALFGAAATVSPWVLGRSGHGTETWVTALVAFLLALAPALWVAMRPGEAASEGVGPGETHSRSA
ncbi:MAG: SPW repeat protein [Firmicutes bacterium]|nr:SPW repeat protein [Bacillota bacterium]